MDDVVFLKEADGKKSIPSFRAAQSCALNRLVKADSKVEYKKHSLGLYFGCRINTSWSEYQ